MLQLGLRKKNLVLLPDILFEERYVGPLLGRYFEASGVFNVVTPATAAAVAGFDVIGVLCDEADILPAGATDAANITDAANATGVSNTTDTANLTDVVNATDSAHAADTIESNLVGYWMDDGPVFCYQGETLEVQRYDLVQKLFSRNTGILESDRMMEKCAIILGCGSVGSLVALELARAGVGHFMLVDNDIVEYHNLCRHQCSLSDVGDYKVLALERRIRSINPEAQVSTHVALVEQLGPEAWKGVCDSEHSIIIGCADNRAADIQGNSIAMLYDVPFLSIGFWERAFAGEIFYHLPDYDMPCYRCALGDGSGLVAQRTETSRRFYTHQQNLQELHFEPGIAADIDFVTLVGVKLILDILNRHDDTYTLRLLDRLTQYTLVCNTDKVTLGGEMAEIFSYPLQVTTSLRVEYGPGCPPCQEK